MFISVILAKFHVFDGKLPYFDSETTRLHPVQLLHPIKSLKKHQLWWRQSPTRLFWGTPNKQWLVREVANRSLWNGAFNGGSPQKIDHKSFFLHLKFRKKTNSWIVGKHQVVHGVLGAFEPQHGGPSRDHGWIYTNNISYDCLFFIPKVWRVVPFGDPQNLHQPSPGPLVTVFFYPASI